MLKKNLFAKAPHNWESSDFGLTIFPIQAVAAADSAALQRWRLLVQMEIRAILEVNIKYLYDYAEDCSHLIQIGISFLTKINISNQTYIKRHHDADPSSPGRFRGGVPPRDRGDPRRRAQRRYRPQRVYPRYSEDRDDEYTLPPGADKGGWGWVVYREELVCGADKGGWWWVGRNWFAAGCKT